MSQVISRDVEKVFAQLLANSKVQNGIQFLKADNENTLADQIQITEIPAPSYQEQKRAAYYQKRLVELGLKDVQMDQEGNVFGIRLGTENGPKLFVWAHLDTVFPEGTNTTVTFKDVKVYAPGIADDGRGLAVVLTLVRALDKANIRTKGDIIFGATVLVAEPLLIP